MINILTRNKKKKKKKSLKNLDKNCKNLEESQTKFLNSLIPRQRRRE